MSITSTPIFNLPVTQALETSILQNQAITQSANAITVPYTYTTGQGSGTITVTWNFTVPEVYLISFVNPTLYSAIKANISASSQTQLSQIAQYVTASYSNNTMNVQVNSCSSGTAGVLNQWCAGSTALSGSSIGYSINWSAILPTFLPEATTKGIKLGLTTSPATSSSSTSNSSTSKSMYIGLAVGGGVLALLLIIILVVMLTRKSS
jgi:hypothetical protein